MACPETVAQYLSSGIKPAAAGIPLDVATINDPLGPPAGGSACGHVGECSTMIWPDPTVCNNPGVTPDAQELMTWVYIRGAPSVLSTISAGTLADLGYGTINYAATDAWPAAAFPVVAGEVGKETLQVGKNTPLVPTRDIDLTLIEDSPPPIEVW